MSTPSTSSNDASAAAVSAGQGSSKTSPTGVSTCKEDDDTSDEEPPKRGWQMCQQLTCYLSPTCIVVVMLPLSFILFTANVRAIDVISQRLDIMEQNNNAFQDRFLNFLEKAFTTPSTVGSTDKDNNDNHDNNGSSTKN